jgi:hypothetical protein
VQPEFKAPLASKGQLARLVLAQLDLKVALELSDHLVQLASKAPLASKDQVAPLAVQGQLVSPVPPE